MLYSNYVIIFQFAEWRTVPLGQDRKGRIYWMFYFSCFIYIEDPQNESWTVLTDLNQLRKLSLCLDERHCNEYALRQDLVEQREDIMAMLESWIDQVPEKLQAPPERITRSRDNKSPVMNVIDILRSDVKKTAEKLWNGQLADIDDADTLSCLIDSAGSNVETLKDMMLRVMNSVPKENQTEHLWSGKEKYVFIEKFNAATDSEELCVFWAIFDHKVNWAKFKQRKIIRQPVQRTSRSSRKSVNYASQMSGYKTPPAYHSEEDEGDQIM